MAIRFARADDFDAIAAITNHYIATTSVHFGYDPVPAGELRDAWQGKPAYVWLVDAADDGAVRAYAKSGPWRDRAAYRWTVETGIYVADGARGRGLGGPLYGELLRELAARDFRSAVAGVTLPNEPSLRLHARLGFELVGTFRDAGFKLGAWHDVAWFQKPFRGPVSAGGGS
jgi:phosphinothricin acetyltransferase|nr:GNAT family N-acetyltransferase [Kofleriaceae bacterium]